MGDQSQTSTVSDAERLAHVQDLLGRMQELAQQAASGKCSSEQCGELQRELVGLRNEIERIQQPQPH